MSFSNVSKTLKGSQELELLLNFICKGLHTCILSFELSCTSFLFRFYTLHPSHQFFSRVGTGLYELIQY